jgi:hypothetical protein
MDFSGRSTLGVRSIAHFRLIRNMRTRHGSLVVFMSSKDVPGSREKEHGSSDWCGLLYGICVSKCSYGQI